MSVHVSNWVWKQSKSNGSTLTVLLALADIADDDGNVPPHRSASVEVLAKKTRLAERTVRYCLRELEGEDIKDGDRTVRPGLNPPELVIMGGAGRRPSRYRVMIDGAKEHEDHDLPAEAKAAGEPVGKASTPGQSLPLSQISSVAACPSEGQHVPLRGASDDVSLIQDVKARKGRKNNRAQARDPSTPPVDKKPDKPDKPDKPAVEYDLTPTLIAWGAENGYAAYLHLHLGVFRDYLLQKPAYAKKHAEALDACFRNCVRADWGKVRQQAQIAARMGQGPDLERWWATSDGMKAKGMSMGLPWDPARYRTFVQYEVSIIDAAIDRDGWGAWIDKGRNSQMYGWVVERRQKRGADVPEGEEIHA